MGVDNEKNVWDDYDLTEFPELIDPEATIAEALRDTISDGDGIDWAVMCKFKAQIRAEVLKDLADTEENRS